MRKIISKHQEEKKRKRNQFIVGGILIFIMLFSVVGYSLGGRESEKITKIKYNNLEFVEKNNFWYTTKGNLDFIFRHNPAQITKINSQLNYVEDYYEKPLYLSSESYEATSEIYTNLNQIVKRMQPACLKEEGCEENTPIKTCEDNFIIIAKSNSTNIFQNESCVFIEGPIENLTKITDEFLFQILHIREQ